MLTLRKNCGVIVMIGLLLAAPYPCDGIGCHVTEFTHDEYYSTANIKIVCEGYADDLVYVVEHSDGLGGVLEIILKNIKDTHAAINEIKRLNDEQFKIVNAVSFTNSYFNLLPSDLISVEANSVLKITYGNLSTVNLNILPYGQKLEELDLSYNKIINLETDPVSHLSTVKLQTINLSHNKIDHIPVNCFFSTRQSLESLDLSHNEISGFDFYAFSSLTKLSHLRLSHNKLINLGLFLFPVRNLKQLYLDHNQIHILNPELFSKSKSLEILDLSYNDIEQIDDNTFGGLTELSSLHLDHNKISSIKEILLRNNTQLVELDLSFNNISYVEPGTFSSMENLRIINLDNSLSTSIQGQSFVGLKVKSLNFAGSNISEIQGRPFITLKNYLLSLNLSSSGIHKISETALDSLIQLNELDLSDNQLTEIAFKTDDLESLTKLHLQNNSIRELKTATFQHMISLTELDLSNNNIKQIPPMAFKNLKFLKSFKITNNELDTAILANTFFGLESVEHLELIHTNLERFDSYAFTGLTSLKVLNASHGQLSYLDDYAFAGTVSIEILDLSYNKIMNLNVKFSPNKNMKEIYLNNNELRNILSGVFEGLGALEVLDISNNNIVTIEPSAFKYLVSLMHLDLSGNPNVKLNGENFKNLESLDSVLLRNVSDFISFDSENISIQNIDMSSGSITNLSSLCIHNIKNLKKLDLSLNLISIMNQYAFTQDMPSLTWLNMSHNNIENINPGTFLKTNAIRHLDLSHNKLVRIPYGALAGLHHLKELDLTNNLLTGFQGAQLYYIPYISKISLDNNKIMSLSLLNGQIGFITKVVTLSVGGNEISCEDIMELKLNSKISITTEILDLYSENVDGIACSVTDYSNPM